MNIFDQMLSRYPVISENDHRNAVYEVMQEIALAGLYRGGFFEKVAFYGGTCLRIFHQMQRFSEDLDFHHFKVRTKQFNGIDITQEEFVVKLKERLATTDITMVKRDVEPFIKDRKELDIWSNDYFVQLADMIKYQ